MILSYSANLITSLVSTPAADDSAITAVPPASFTISAIGSTTSHLVIAPDKRSCGTATRFGLISTFIPGFTIDAIPPILSTASRTEAAIFSASYKSVFTIDTLLIIPRSFALFVTLFYNFCPSCSATSNSGIPLIEPASQYPSAITSPTFFHFK